MWRLPGQASDNDALSTDPLHRDADDWWMHAAGCAGALARDRPASRAPSERASAAAGSHVVIRAESVGDAATLPREASGKGGARGWDEGRGA